MIPRFLLASLGLGLAAALAATPFAPAENADVIVYGGTSAGVTAAVQAARMGKRVILVEPGYHLGGMSSSGLGLTDTGSKQTIGGLSREFYHRIFEYYKNPAAWKYGTRDEYFGAIPRMWTDAGAKTEGEQMQFTFEPHVAEGIYNDMVREAGVKVVFGERLDLQKGVEKTGAAIRSIAMESGRKFFGRMFIDATYEGDLMAKAGVKYKVGREPNSQYGEKFNGILPSGGQPFLRVDPYVEAGNPASGLLPRIDPKPPGVAGEGDNRNQAYNFRMCITRVPQNRIPFEKPANYDPKNYELLARWMAPLPPMHPDNSSIGELIALRGDRKGIAFSFNAMPNLKTDSNSGEFGTDYYGRSYTWADGDYTERQRVYEDHKTYSQGLLWFLAHDERVPEPVRQEMQQWGLPKDEFADTGHWPFQLYVREARRMVGDYVVTEHDCRGEQVAPDGVALASYAMDSHGVSLYINEEGYLTREKGIYQKSCIFPISYRAIRPSAAQCTNLLVPVAVSASHVGYAPIRMEPVYMMLGQSAATAACLAIDAKTTVQALPYDLLRKRLLTDKQVLDAPPARKSPAPTPAP